MIYVFIILGLYLIGVALYAAFASNEKPEGFETDVEHSDITAADGGSIKRPLLKRSLLKRSLPYWLDVISETLFSYPAAWLRRLFGKSTP
jgi:hypothetical protein